MTSEIDIRLNDGRALHVYDAGVAEGSLPVFWHHGTPNIGAPPEPLFTAASEFGFRWVSYDRPGYGGSSAHAGRDVASAAADTAAAADALGLDRFAVMGHSGGGPHALACAALLPHRVVAAVSISGLAPFDADGLDWFAGMASAGSAELHAAVEGRGALAALLESTEFDPEQFTAADFEALSGEWSWLNSVVGPALENGVDPMVDDDLAYVAPWAFDPADISAPILLVHGIDDRVVPSSHSSWLAAHCPTAELWLRQGESHVSVLNSAGAALEWILSARR